MARHFSIVLATVVATGCSDTRVGPAAELGTGAMQASIGRVIHRVSVGGPDFCAAFGARPACDANMSLSALQYADGSVSGQWHDQSAPNVLAPDLTGGFGIHISGQCLYVNGNQAWVGGVIRESRFTPFVGLPVAIRVADNGRTAKDPLDEFSLTSIGLDICTVPATPDLQLFIAPQGQVVVE